MKKLFCSIILLVISNVFQSVLANHNTNISDKNRQYLPGSKAPSNFDLDISNLVNPTKIESVKIKQKPTSNQNIRQDIPPALDSRIRTYKYNSGMVYNLVLHFGFQSQIEFEPKEQIKNIYVGDGYAITFTPLDNRIFIKTLERKNIHTNMTVITTKNVYQFDVVAKDLDPEHEDELIYLIKLVN